VASRAKYRVKTLKESIMNNIFGRNACEDDTIEQKLIFAINAEIRGEELSLDFATKVAIAMVHSSTSFTALKEFGEVTTWNRLYDNS